MKFPFRGPKSNRTKSVFDRSRFTEGGDWWVYRDNFPIALWNQSTDPAATTSFKHPLFRVTSAMAFGTNHGFSTSGYYLARNGTIGLDFVDNSAVNTNPTRFSEGTTAPALTLSATRALYFGLHLKTCTVAAGVSFLLGLVERAAATPTLTVGDPASQACFYVDFSTYGAYWTTVQSSSGVDTITQHKHKPLGVCASGTSYFIEILIEKLVPKFAVNGVLLHTGAALTSPNSAGYIPNIQVNTAGTAAGNQFHIRELILAAEWD